MEREYEAKGLVRTFWRHFAFLGAESSWAAEAAECAGEQGRFWEYHDKLFAEQRGENRGAYAKVNLKRFAKELGLEEGAFAACLDTGRYVSLVREETDQGRRGGVRATPTLFVNGQKIEGAPPTAPFRSFLDALLQGPR